MNHAVFPRTGDTQTVYLKKVITNPNIQVGEYTIYNDFVNDPVLFEKNNVLYQYPVNHDKLTAEQNSSSTARTIRCIHSRPIRSRFFLKNGDLSGKRWLRPGTTKATSS